MKVKIITWCTVFALVLSFVGLTFILKGDKVINYGLKNGNINFSENDTDITDSVIGSQSYTALENENFSLSLDGSANPVITHKKSGRVWKAVPDENAGNSKYASSLILNYFSDSSTNITLYSSEGSVDKNQVKVFALDNCVRVEYIFGEIVADYVYPEMISKERMEQFTSKMNEDDADYLLRRYRLYVLSEYDDTDKDYLLSQYPRLKDEDLYILQEMSTKLMKKKTDEILRNAGYTAEDRDKDNGGDLVEKVNPQTFKASLNYSLTDNGFKVTVNSDECLYYSDYPLTNINILPYFDSFTQGDNGYFVLPSGSGALMDAATDNEETQINIPVYGENLTINSDFKELKQQYILPVFGQYKGSGGYLCILDKGSQQANIVVDRNTVASGASADFTLIDHGDYTMSSSNPVQLFANGESESEFSAEYVLFNDLKEETAYSQMAVYYRKLLINKGVLSENTKGENALLVADFIGAINYDTMALGFIPVNREYALTTFEDVEKITNELSEYATDGIRIMLSGWNQKGLNRQKLGELEFSNKLGGKKGYESLVQNLKKKGVKTYLDVNFALTEKFSDDGFSVTSQGARGINNSIAKLKLYDALSNGTIDSGFNLVSPELYSKLMSKYLKNDLLKQSGINVSELTSVLYGDYVDDIVISKKQAIKEITSVLSEAKKKGISISGKAGNSYALQYMELITDISLTSSGINAFYRDVPFVQMVLHGYVDYTSESLNNSENMQRTLLKLIETGSGMHYTLTANSFDKLFETEYEHIYNTNYSYLKDRILNAYKTLNTALSGLNDVAIKEHCYIDDEIVKVTYENGTVIYVNYSEKDYFNNDIKIFANNYLRLDK